MEIVNNPFMLHMLMDGNIADNIGSGLLYHADICLNDV